MKKRWTWFTCMDSNEIQDDIPKALQRIEAEGWEVVSIVYTGEWNGKKAFRVFCRMAEDATKAGEDTQGVGR